MKALCVVGYKTHSISDGMLLRFAQLVQSRKGFILFNAAIEFTNAQFRILVELFSVQG
jgi:hypothetical protein